MNDTRPSRWGGLLIFCVASTLAIAAFSMYGSPVSSEKGTPPSNQPRPEGRVSMQPASLFPDSPMQPSADSPPAAPASVEAFVAVPENDPYSEEALSQSFAISLGREPGSSSQITNEEVARHRERKFNDYLSKVASSADAPDLPSAAVPDGNSQEEAERLRNDPYEILRREAAENPDAGRRSDPQSYLSKVQQLGLGQE